MKQVQQNYRSGELRVVDVPAPCLGDGELLVATRISLISSGTEKQLVQLARSSLAGKAVARPDLVRRVLATVSREGLRPTLEKVFAKLDTPIPLGYSLVGEVVESGRKAVGFPLGCRVACAGAGLANHAEFNAVPKNLSVRVPSGVDDEDASFVTLGAIALQGVRIAAPTLGESVVVIGLGLIGLLTVQILKANGCRVIGFDPDDGRVTLAKQMGADVATTGGLAALVASRTSGHGADAVIVTASSRSNEPVNTAAEISRMKGRIVVVGLVGLSIDREAFYKRELDLRLSMSYGPGRNDPVYEAGGVDYPLPYVRWTEQRNMEAFLGLIADGRVTPKTIITHRFPIAKAEDAYRMVESGAPHLAILLTYPETPDAAITRRIIVAPTAAKQGLGVAFVGLGNYARGVLLPKVRAAKGVSLTTVVTKTGISATHSARKFGFAQAATDPGAAFDDAAADAVFIATRHDTHAALTARALRAGKHVFCEKPLAIDADGLAAVLAAVAASNGILTVGFNRRFAPLLVKARQAFAAKPEPLVMTYRVNAGALPAGSWIEGDEGGGRVLGEVCHFVDALTFLCGEEPVEALALATGTLSASVSILLRFAGGSVGTIVYATAGDPGVPKEYLEAFGTGCVVRLDDYVRLTINASGTEQVIKSRQDKGQERLVSAFLEAARGRAPAPIPLADLVAVSRITLDIAEGLRSGRSGR